jgi:hypothetical protein
MSLQIKLVNAVLSHDTETFSNMVHFPPLRTPTAFYKSVSKSSNPRPRVKLGSGQFGMRLLTLPPRTPY